MAKFLVVGSGAFGSAISQVLVSNNHEVYVYGICDEELNDLYLNQKNTRYFGELKLSNPIKGYFNKIEDAFESNNYDAIIIAIPSFAIANFVDSIQNYDIKKTIIINASKGLNPETNSSWCHYISKKLNFEILVGFSGPSFAIDLFSKKPTVVNILSHDDKINEKVAGWFNNSWFKAIPSNEPEKSNYISCLKNALAIGCGIIHELYQSSNSSAAYLTKGINEIKLILENKISSNSHTLDYFFIGDTIMTCTDTKSRNFQFGQNVAKFGVKYAIENNKATVEGINNLMVVKQIIDEFNIKSPLFTTLFNIIYDAKEVECIFDSSIK